MGRNAIEKRKEHPLPPSPPVPFYRLGRSTWPCTRRSHMSFLLCFVRTLPFPYYLSVPSPSPCSCSSSTGREGGRIPATDHELSGIAENWGQFSSAGHDPTRKVKLGAPPLCVARSVPRRGGTRVVPASCPRRQEHGAPG